MTRTHWRRSVGRATLHFDFPGVEVGAAEYPDGPTGVTVLHFPGGARTYVDARGGAVGLYGGYDVNHALCFAGGSVYGQGAGAGVSDELLLRLGGHTGFDDLRLVSTAVIYDLGIRPNTVVPDAELGRAAMRTARPGRFPQGRAGAGCSASAGKIAPERAELSGQGAAYADFGGAKILVATVANPVGVIVDRQGNILRGNFDAAENRRRHPAEDYRAALTAGAPVPAPSGNTTLTAVVTNVRLSDGQLARLGIQVHGSMHRGIQPFHTERDGDVLFAVTTDEADLPPAAAPPGSKEASVTGLATLAEQVAWDALIECAR